jgi:hypothetical protein
MGFSIAGNQEQSGCGSVTLTIPVLPNALMWVLLAAFYHRLSEWMLHEGMYSRPKSCVMEVGVMGRRAGGRLAKVYVVCPINTLEHFLEFLPSLEGVKFHF